MACLQKMIELIEIDRASLILSEVSVPHTVFPVRPRVQAHALLSIE